MCHNMFNWNIVDCDLKQQTPTHSIKSIEIFCELKWLKLFLHNFCWHQLRYVSFLRHITKFYSSLFG